MPVANKSYRIQTLWIILATFSCLLAYGSWQFRFELRTKIIQFGASIKPPIKNPPKRGGSGGPKGKGLTIRGGAGINIHKDPKPPVAPTEEQEYIELWNKPSLRGYIYFINKYPNTSKYEELVSRIQAFDPKLPNKRFWKEISPNNRGYWERDYKSITLVWIPYKQAQIKDGFWIGKIEVTTRQFRRYLEGNNQEFNYYSNADDEPVRSVSWLAASNFCEWLGLRLPTVAEWQWAALGSEDSSEYWEGASSSMGSANLNSAGVRIAGNYLGNGYDLLDMLGNVEEWCQDWFLKDPSSPPIFRIYMGGSFANKPGDISVKRIKYMNPSYEGETIGFRVAGD